MVKVYGASMIWLGNDSIPHCLQWRKSGLMATQKKSRTKKRYRDVLVFTLYVFLYVMFLLSSPFRLDAGRRQPMDVDERSVQDPRIQLAQSGYDPPVPPPEVTEAPIQQSQEKTTVPPSSPSLPLTAAQGIAEGSITQGQVSLNFDDADIYSVIQTIFANILRYNYIIDPKVRGRVTFRSIAPVAREDVLPVMEVILRLNGIAIVEENGLYRIIPMSDAPREPSPVGFGRDPQGVKLSGKALLQVVPIRYLQSTEMVKLLTPFVSTSAVIVDVPKNNYIIIVDTDSNVKRLLKLVDLFDNEQQREKRPQVFLYHVQNTKAKDMATLLQQIFLGAKAPAEQIPARTTGGSTTQTPAATTQPQRMPTSSPTIIAATPQMVGESIVSVNTKIIPDEILNAIVIIATAEDYAAIKQTIDKIDLVPRQVLIEAIVAQVDLIDNMSLGIAWSLKANLGGLLSSTIGLNVPISAPTEGGFPLRLSTLAAKSGR